MARAFIGIGIPRSGKTQILKELAIKEKSLFVSANELRSKLARTDYSRTLNEIVWEEIYQLAHRALGTGGDIVIDASNARVYDRRDLANHCRKLAHEVIGIYVQTPIDICLERNRQMGKNSMPEHAIRQLAQELEWHPPSHRDGLDQIRIVVG